MHEAGLMAEAVEQAVAAAERAGASRIVGVTFGLASGGHVTPEIMKTLFAAVSRGTLAEGAMLAIETQPIRAYCLQCDDTFLAADTPPTLPAPCCPTCGSLAIPEMGTAELVLLSIEIPD